MKKALLVVLSGICLFVACSEDGDPGASNDNFNREELLINWADNIIIPAYLNYSDKINILEEANETFQSDKSTQNLIDLRLAWENAYIAWQSVSMFEIGKAEELTLRDYTNLYPTNVDNIETAIATNEYNFELPSARSQQGFPAIDYLINGLGSNEEITDIYVSNENYGSYLSALIARLKSLTDAVVADWNGGYRDTFISRSGSDASSSVNKLVNDFMFYYEKSLRAGKVGIPAGVFSNTPLPDRVEAYYKKDISKKLLTAALNESINFFNGVGYTNKNDGIGLDDYLTYVNAISEGENLSQLINSQFGFASDKVSQLNDNFTLQVESNNEGLLKAYDELQKNVILMKVDMFQALNVKVDFVDADGD